MNLLRSLSCIALCAGFQSILAPQAKSSAELGGKNPLVAMEPMIGGEWRMKTKDGSQMIETWQWGPGKKSLKIVTHGFNASDNNFPWRDIELIYWHPLRKEIRMLGVSPVWRGVREGAFTAKVGNLSGTIDLYQTVGKFKLGWDLNSLGANQFLESLSSENPAGKMERFVDWTFERSKSITPPVYPKKGAKIVPSELMKEIGNVIGIWKHENGKAITFEYVPYADAIYFSSSYPATKQREMRSEHGLIYHHTGTKELRYFAISNSGEVAEGTAAKIKTGNWEIKMKVSDAKKVRNLTRTFSFHRHGELGDKVTDGTKTIESAMYPWANRRRL